jgi:hypothetical protein
MITNAQAVNVVRNVLKKYGYNVDNISFGRFNRIVIPKIYFGNKKSSLFEQSGQCDCIEEFIWGKYHRLAFIFANRVYAGSLDTVFTPAEFEYKLEKLVEEIQLLTYDECVIKDIIE